MATWIGDMRGISLGKVGDARVTRFLLALVLSLVLYGVFLLLSGKNPFDVYQVIYQGSLANSYDWGEVLVKLTPVLLCALATAIPAQVGLVNVGAPGQLLLGAWAATGAELAFGNLPGPVLVPIMMLAGFAGGAVWAGLPALGRVYLGLNETISTLLMNYIAERFVNVFIYGTWKDPLSFGYPNTPDFPPAARLPTLSGSRVHLGIVFGLVALAATYLVLRRTNWGYRMRAIGGNPDAARRVGMPISRYIIVSMLIGGGLAGLAGMGEVSGIVGRLQEDIGASTLGYLGFLASWLALHNPLGLAAMSALLSVLAVGGDVLQTAINLPSAAVNILIGLMLFCVMGTRRQLAKQRK